MYDGNDIEFFEGERKTITATVKSKDRNEVVVINDATYEVSTVSDGIVESGTCVIDGTDMSLVLGLERADKYYLTVTAYIGQEIIKQRAVIRVRK